ncbi:MAG: molybdopterin converting factor subunit 1 [Vulcanimicrobiaceae bacterium]
MDTQPTSAATEIRVLVLAFARVREVIGSSEIQRTIRKGATIEEVWAGFVREQPALEPLAGAMRFACNGSITPSSHVVADGDEIAFLPPVSGG